MPDQVDKQIAVRHGALEFALRACGNGAHYAASELIDAARKIEAYLLGESEAQAEGQKR